LAAATGAAVGVTLSGALAAWYLRRLQVTDTCSICASSARRDGCSCSTQNVVQLRQPVRTVSLLASEPERPIALPAPDPYSPEKRPGAMSWDDYFMALAFLSAQRSKDPNKQVGACIVSGSNIILSIGYNGFPRGIPDESLPWAKLSSRGDPLDTKYPYVCHAEANAILNANTDKMTGQRIYVTMFPCNECAKLLIQAGLAEVVYCEAKDPPHQKAQDHACYEASRRLLNLAGVQMRQHQLHFNVSFRGQEGILKGVDDSG